MTDFAISPEALQTQITETLGSKAKSVVLALGEVTVVVGAADYLEAATLLRDAPGCPPTAEALLYGIIQLQNKIRRTNTISR